MPEIFIHEWKIQDYAGRRDKSIVSEGTINGEHVYACKKLTTWFRLGKYLIKHDMANYLLGLTKYMSREEFHHNVKAWDWHVVGNIGREMNCVDEIVKVVNKRFKANDYVEALLVLQEAIKGYEECVVLSRFYKQPFDYIRFLSDRDAYQRIVKGYTGMLKYKQFIKK